VYHQQLILSCHLKIGEIQMLYNGISHCDVLESMLYEVEVFRNETIVVFHWYHGNYSPLVFTTAMQKIL